MLNGKDAQTGMDLRVKTPGESPMSSGLKVGVIVKSKATDWKDVPAG